MRKLVLSIRRNRILVLFFTVLNLTGCLESPDTSDLEIPPDSPSRVVANAVLTYSADVLRSGTLEFPRIDERLLDADGGYRVYLELRFDRPDRFPLEKMRLAFNGIRGSHPAYFDLGDDAEWVQDENGTKLLINVSELRFENGAKSIRRIGAIQRQGGILSLWIKCPRSVVAARLIFVDEPDERDVRPLPRVALDGISYGNSAFWHRLVHFRFHAIGDAVGFECSLNHAKFRRCESPATYWLRPGYHVFRVRAIAAGGRRGPVLHHRFWRHWGDPTVEITDVDPAESPTRKDSITVQFRVRNHTPPWLWQFLVELLWEHVCQRTETSWGLCRRLADAVQQGAGADSAFCQLDDGNVTSCRSPVRYEGLAEGAHSITIRGYGEDGDEEIYAWVIDRGAPQIQWLATPPSQTSETQARFEFRASEEVSFSCAVDGGSFASCASPLVLEDLAPGSHGIEIFATDAAGNRSERLTYVWSIDDGIPVVELLSVNPTENPTGSQQARFTVAVSEPADLYCFVDEPPPLNLEEFEPYACESPLFLDELAEGEHTVTFAAIDASGNVSDYLEYSWTIDLSGPSFDLTLVAPPSVPTNWTSAQFAFASPEPASFTCAIDGGALFACASPYTLEEVGQGLHEFRVDARDAVGNTTTSTFVWEVDLTPPAVTLGPVVPEEPITTVRSIEIPFTVSETATVLCELDGAGLGPCQSPFVANHLEDGQHEWRLVATDPAGNVTERLYEWTVFSPPVVTLDSVSPEESPTILTSARFTFSSSNTASFVCAIDGEAYAPCASPFERDELSSGEHSFRVAGVDIFGEPGEAVVHNWTIDTSELAIGQFSVSQITRDSAVITWATNFSATSMVRYGIGQLNQQSPISPDTTTSHVVLLTGLQPNTFYSVQAESVDAWGRTVTSAIQGFRTLR